MKDSKFIYLNQTDVVKAGGLELDLIFNAVEKGFYVHGSGECVQPPKLNLKKGAPGSAQADQGVILAKPAYMGGDLNFIGIKWCLGMTDNPTKRDLPRSNAIIILNDADTGLPICIMDGTIINVIRTGVVSSVGAKYLARPESEAMALFGAGTQGRYQIKAIAHVMKNLKSVSIYDVFAEKAEALASEINRSGILKATVAATPEENVAQADIVVCATISKAPYLHYSWLKKGTFYVDVAANDALPEVYAAADKIYVDDWKQIKFHGFGSLIAAINDGILSEKIISGDLGAVVVGKMPGRQNTDNLTIFKHIGMASTDLPVAFAIYSNAKSMGLGTQLNLWDEAPLWA